jgi:hypothetical protein
VTEATTTAIATVAAATVTAAKKKDNQLKAAVEKVGMMAAVEARGERQ